MTADKSTRYDFGKCAVDYVTESDFYSDVTIRFRQEDGLDEAQITLGRDDAIGLLQRVLEVLHADPSGLIFAQLSGQTMIPTTR